MNSNYDVIQCDCPNCPFADLFGGFCFYYRFYPANIGYVGLADKDDSCILLASKNSYQDNTFADGTPFGVKVEE